MKPRIDFQRVNPRAVQAMLGLQNFVNNCGLEHSLMELVKMRASQINHCAYCLDMHSKDMRAAGETEQRIYLLDAWREVSFYTPRERAALEWTESLSLVSETGAPDSVYASVREHFTEEEIVNLSLSIVAINGWNRLCVGFRAEAGTYRPRAAAPRASA